MEAHTPHERLRLFRLKKEMTQEQLAELLECSTAQLCRIEKQQRNPGRGIAARLAKLTARCGSPIRVEDWP